MDERGHAPIPLVILGGSDPRAAPLPAEVRDHHSLSGYKGVTVRIGGKPLVSHLIERLQRTGVFDPILIAGPAEVYRKVRTPVPVIDTNGSLGFNLRVTLETMLQEHPGSRLAFITCDVLPDLEELQSVLDDLLSGPPVSFWFPLVRAPSSREELGAFGWKPRYRMIPREETEPVAVLPGHLVVTEPSALRLHFLYQFLELIYRTRNRPIGRRRGYLVRHLLLAMAARDVRNFFLLRPPTFTCTVLRHGLRAARLAQEGRLSVAELEDALSHIFLKRRARRRHAGTGVRLPIVGALSLARDIDTEEEAQAAGR